MEQRRACPACASSEHVPAFIKNGHAHRECVACGAIFLSLVPSAEELERLYSDDPESSACWSNTHAHVKDMWASVLRDAQRLAGEGPLLDVGCGAGQFLEYAGTRGWAELVGIELPFIAPGVAERNATVHRCRFGDEPLAGGRFALVTLWDVLEHLPHPRVALARARELLRPGGLIVATLPNRAGLSMRVFGKNALTVVPPEHLLYGTRLTMEALLRGGGFRPHRIETRDVFIKEWIRLLPSSSKGSAERREQHARWYSRLTGSRAALRGIRIVNRIIAATRLGDLVLGIGQKE